ncbi:hypothetical protein QBC42DRAFT_282832 [Cladorrhinum samala]|uniref:Uncharacterized protein n=1 Tax=Cladorrhinum samala TaxID=585594 RepID=A0AAV9HZY5_9PEZI|nr:hypothetical protein QBC42DRAFT_282832 [Cladorrhinum samala]
MDPIQPGTKAKPWENSCAPSLREGWLCATILAHNTAPLEVDWDAVTRDNSYKSAGVTTVRWGQIRRKLRFDAIREGRLAPVDSLAGDAGDDGPDDAAAGARRRRASGRNVDDDTDQDMDGYNGGPSTPNDPQAKKKAAKSKKNPTDANTRAGVKKRNPKTTAARGTRKVIAVNTYKSAEFVSAEDDEDQDYDDISISTPLSSTTTATTTPLRNMMSASSYDTDTAMQLGSSSLTPSAQRIGISSSQFASDSPTISSRRSASHQVDSTPSRTRRVTSQHQDSHNNFSYQGPGRLNNGDIDLHAIPLHPDSAARKLERLRREREEASAGTTDPSHGSEGGDGSNDDDDTTTTQTSAPTTVNPVHLALSNAATTSGSDPLARNDADRDFSAAEPASGYRRR